MKENNLADADPEQRQPQDDDFSGAREMLDKLTAPGDRVVPPVGPTSANEAYAQIEQTLGEISERHQLPMGKPQLLEYLTDRLKLMTRDENWNRYLRQARKSSQFMSLGTEDELFLTRRRPAREQHEMILAFLERAGFSTADQELTEIREYFDKRDGEKRAKSMASFASHGLLTFGEAQRSGVLDMTSATPADVYDPSDYLDIGEDGVVLGYGISRSDRLAELFNGDDGFLSIAAESGWDSRGGSDPPPPAEIQNRIRNSVLFLVRRDKLPHLQRTLRSEDASNESILPEAIDYVLVHEQNADQARLAFGALKVVAVPDREETLSICDDPIFVPDYQGATERILAQDGPIWGHIARLPTDTYLH